MAAETGADSGLTRRALAIASLAGWATVDTIPAAAASRLSVDEVRSRLIECFEVGQYYVSGQLDRGIFEENCTFTDPTIKVTGAR